MGAAQAWLGSRQLPAWHRAGTISFQHGTGLKAAGLAATSPACSELCNRRRGGEVAARGDKKYQGFRSAWAVQPDKGPSPCPLCRGRCCCCPPSPQLPLLCAHRY